MPTTPSHDQAHDTTTARVAAGVAWLDTHEPGWRERIDLDRLDMSAGTYVPAADGPDDPGWCGCICAQLDARYGSYTHFVETRAGIELDGEQPADNDLARWAIDHGFALDPDRPAESWAALTRAWQGALRATSDPGLELPPEGVGQDG